MSYRRDVAAPSPVPPYLLPSDIRALVERDGPYCVWCSRHVGLAVDDCTRDHLIARSKGGKTGLANYVLACSRCNSRRKSESAQSWLAGCDRRGLRVRRHVIEDALARAQAADMVRVSKLSHRSRLKRKRANGKLEA